jgi:hypothetical protein
VGWYFAMNRGAYHWLDLWRFRNEELPTLASQLRHNRLSLPFNNSESAEPTFVKVNGGDFTNSF